MSLFTKPLLLLLSFYQMVISPFLGPHCRFQPSCSHYAKEALQKHGLMVGIWLTLRRLFRCHPWGKSGSDPVPEKEHYRTL